MKREQGLRISIITATLGEQPGYLRLAGESLVAQTEKSIEWIIVSKIPIEISKNITDNIPVKIIVNEHYNLSQARNAGIAVAQGEFISFMDDDEMKKPKFCERLIPYARNIDGVFCFMDLIDDNGYLGDHRVPTSDYSFAISIGGLWFTNEMFLRTESLRKIGCFDSELYTSEDFDLALRLMKEYKIKICPEMLCVYRKHPDSMSVAPDIAGKTQINLRKIFKKHGLISENCFICNEKIGIDGGIVTYRKGRWGNACDKCHREFA